jgi:hypothetical protein
MEEVTVAICIKLLKQYIVEDNIQEQQLIRNKLYSLLSTYIISYIKLFLRNERTYLQESEIISISWDCFEFSLKNYRFEKSISIPNHFRSYTRFYLLIQRNKQRKRKTVLENFLFTESKKNSRDKLVNSNDNIDCLDGIKIFRSMLDEEHISVFDDAIMSMAAGTKHRIRRLKESPLHYYKYCEAKKIFKVVIDYLLRK